MAVWRLQTPIALDAVDHNSASALQHLALSVRSWIFKSGIPFPPPFRATCLRFSARRSGERCLPQFFQEVHVSFHFAVSET